jgi:hypothetical protein
LKNESALPQAIQETKKSMIDRTLPNDIEAEKNVLGACLRSDPEAVCQARDILKTPAAFFEPKHEKIFSAILETADKGIPSDQATIGDSLNRRGEFEVIGGPFYLHELYYSVASSANVEHHARIVRDRYQRRLLIHSLHEKTEAAWNLSEDPATITEQLRCDILRFADNTNPPRPLMREIPPAAMVIYESTQAPLAMCAQSVPAAAALSVQPFVDVENNGKTFPTSNYFLTIPSLPI